jgi:hypothetical protein
MAIQTIEVPNEFNYAKQTIPFLVKSTLIGPGGTGGIDPIERAFRFVFDVVVQLGNGTYKTYASIAIPPRPDNYYSFFDVSPLIIDAISFDLGTHKQTFATACANSITKFKVFCTERYLDTTGAFISGTKTSLGEYYAIDGAGNEGITPYLIDGLTNNKKPLHYHQLMGGDDFAVIQKEPLTLSWLSRNDLGVNELEYIHGNYGTFSNIAAVGVATSSNVMTAYTGITKNALTTLGVGATTTPPSLRTTLAGVTGTATSLMIFKFTNLDLSASTSYKFTIGAKVLTGPYPGGSATSSPSNALTFRPVVVGTNFTPLTGVGVTVTQASLGSPTTWPGLTITFATNSSFTTGDITAIEIQVQTPNATSFPLGLMNNVNVNWTSATLYETANTSTPFVADVQVITDDNTVYTMPTGYTANIIPLNDTAQSRFDTPVGPYKQYHPTGQDATTGFWLNTGGTAAKWFRVRLRNALGAVIGLSEKIYQKLDNCEKCEKFRLKWKNQLGGWDYYTFTMVSKARTSIERENFKRSRGTISATSYQELTSDRGYQSLNIKLLDTYTVISDWVEDGTAKWMLDLFTSDEVYLLNPEPFQKYVTTTEFDLEYPVFVQQEEVEFMNNSVEAKLKNFVIEITPAIRFEQNTTN